MTSEEGSDEESSALSPRRVDNWGDSVFSDSEEVIDDLDVLDKSTQTSAIPDGHIKTSFCCHKLPSEPKIGEMLWLAGAIPLLTSVDCMVNNIRGYVNHCLQFCDSYDSNEKMNLLDSYMRLRHDSLSALMVRCLGQGFLKTDQKFSDMFPITSKRTPDFIFKAPSCHIIIEVAAVSDPERAYKKKGHTDLGYVSKYNRELTELRSLGIPVEYKVIVFDTSSLDSQDYLVELKSVSSTLNTELDRNSLFDLDFLRKEHITATSLMFDEYAKYLNSLYGNPYSLPLNTEIVSDIFGEPRKRYEGKYMRVGVSNFIYDKVVSVTPRLDTMLSKVYNHESPLQKFKLVFDQLSSNFKFVRSNKDGDTTANWQSNINASNYAWICSKLCLELKGSEVRAPKADYEFLTYEPKSSSASRSQYLSLQSLDHNEGPITEVSQPTDYSGRVKNFQTLKKDCMFEDETLEARIISSICEMDVEAGSAESLVSSLRALNHRPLCTYTVDEDAFKRSVERYEDAWNKINSSGSEVTILPHNKAPTIYPIAQIQGSDYISFRQKPSLLEGLKTCNLGKYTDAILDVARSQSFQFGSSEQKLNNDYEECKMELSKYHRVVLAELKELKKQKEGILFPKLSELANAEEHRGQLSLLNQKLHAAAKSCGAEHKNIGVITMSKGVKSKNNQDFKEEMGHFRLKDSKAHYKGVANNFDGDYLLSIFRVLKENLFAPCDKMCEEPLYDSFVAEDTKLLKQLKDISMKNSSSYYDHLRSTNLYHACAFISRLCHTLMFHSQSSLNSSKVVVDNLGYDSVVLIIKGGKKVFSTKRSKLFRLIFPTFKTHSLLYDCGGLPTNHIVSTIEGRTYITTPWMNMHETVMADGITFLHRTMGFAMLNRVEALSNYQNLDRVFFNILLAIHNRRQTESMLHNLRYIFMNCMSEVSAIEEILPELAGFNYDFFQAWIRYCIKKKFFTFASKLLKSHRTSNNSKLVDFEKLGLTHMFNGHEIKDVNTLAIGIYSSYLMSKAPTTQLLEQVRNMRSIMTTHDDFMSKVGDVKKCYRHLSSSFKGYSEELQENDFNLDPSYCFLLGKFMGDYLSNLEKKSKMIQRWDSILEKPWDELSNTKGLRGSGSDFFGNKGYYVVYKDVLSDPTKINNLLSLLASDVEVDIKEKAVHDSNETYRFRISEKPLDQVVFHVVDKVQRGGSREIYVMDMETKVHQQVIEDYTKYLCKLVPNEMISIPSNKRLSTIHSRVFETTRDHSEKYYWVLDCRKWAPKSVIEKFMIFLMGAKNALPETFIVHSLNFFSMMLKKRVYTRPAVVNALLKSKGNKMFEKHFKFDDDKKAYYFDMPYSWVMGIFNYFSSLMHVAVQLHASHIIRLSSHLSFGQDNILHMVAHSDDSAGKIMVNSRAQMLRASYIYETLMHASNHLLSKKKCNQGKVYYEFISILYIGGKLLSLLSKFTGMFNYHPTDKGYCADITDAYSKSTELLLNGATFEQSYLSMKIQVMLIYRFYFGKDMPQKYYNYPPSMFGIPDSHPLMSLLCGSDADLFRIMKTSTEENKNLICAVNRHLIPLASGQTGLLKAFQCTPRVSLSKKLQHVQSLVVVPENLATSWTMKNVRFRNTQLNAVQFCAKLSDKGFIAALQDESLTRRLSRSYYYRSHITVKTAYGDMSPRDIRELIHLMDRAVTKDTTGLNDFTRDVIEQAAESGDFSTDNSILFGLFEYLYCEVSRIYEYMDKISFAEDCLVEHPKTCKPVYITIQKTVEECPIDYNPQALSSWMKEPEYRSLLPDTRGFHTAEKFVRKSLSEFDLDVDDVQIEQLNLLLQKIKQKSKTEYFCYSNLPTDLREISTYQDLLNFLSHNSFQNKMIKGLTIQFGKTISVPMEHLNKNLSGVELQYSLSMLVLANALMTSRDFDSAMLTLDFENPDFLGGGATKLGDLLRALMDYWSKRKTIFQYFKALALTTQSLLDGESSFDADVMKDTFFHSYVKRQFLVDNVWLGQGKLFISAGQVKFCFVIVNIRIQKVYVQLQDYVLDMDQVAYMNLCLQEGQLSRIQESMCVTNIEDWGTLGLCYDVNGSYYVGDVRGSIRHIQAQVDTNLTTKLSSFEKGRVKSFKGSKLMWEAHIDDSRYSYQISVLPVEVQNSVTLLRGKMLETRHNNEILSGDVLDSKSLIIEVCAKELDLERIISAENVIRNYHLTETYRVMKTCEKLSLCKTNDPPLRVTNFPASDGGMLNMLISYSKHDPRFDFKWQRTVSPEYMLLKSSQPEAFVTDFVSAIKERFDNLYTDVDKEAIHRSLSALADRIWDEKGEEELMNLLCTWGYAGVAGALNELGGAVNKSNFEKIRDYSSDAPYISLFSGLYNEVCGAVYSSYKGNMTTEGFIPAQAFGSPFHVNVKNLGYHFMSSVHSTTLDTYNSDKLDNWVVDDGHLFMIACLNSVMAHPGASASFQEHLKSNLVLRGLPVGVKHTKDWVLAFNSMRSCYIKSHKSGGRLDYNVRKDQENRSISPYVQTRDLLAKIGVKVETKGVFHYGAISRYLHGILKSNFMEDYKGEKVWFNVEMVKMDDFESVLDVPYNHLLFPERRFNEDFLDSDEYEEIKMELQSDSPDIDYYEENLSAGEDPWVIERKKRVKTVINGRLTNVVKFDLKIVLLLGGNCTMRSYDQIRMLGDDTIIVTNKLPLRLLLNEGFMTYRSRDNAWQNHCIINPNTIYYTVITRDLPDDVFWCRVLNADVVTKQSINPIRASSYFLYRNERGVVENLDDLGSDIWEHMEENLAAHDKDLAEELEAKNKAESFGGQKKVVDLNVKKFVDAGLDSDQINKYKEVAKMSANRKGWEEVFKVLDSMSTETKDIPSNWASKITQVVQKPKTARQHEMIMQVPRVFGGGRDKGAPTKNNLFREKKIIAEVEAICPGLLWKVLSGTLYISQRTYDMVTKQLILYRMMVKGAKEHKRGKQFMINLCKLMLNDSVIIDNPEEDMEIWRALTEATLAIMLIDEPDSPEDEVDFMGMDDNVEVGVLKYGVAGERGQ